MSDEVHPADEVPGGLWEGAVVRGPTGDTPLPRAKDWQEGEHLVLPGPLGLGLAGLAVRICQRRGWMQTTHTGLVADWVAVECDPARGRMRLTTRTDPQSLLVAYASYLALTDRLCGAVGLELQPGEVARWDRALGVWRITCGNRWENFDVPQADWLGALRACVAATEAS